MSMNVNTTGTVYGSYQNTYKAGTVDKKKEAIGYGNFVTPVN